MNLLFWAKRAVKNMLNGKGLPETPGDLMISEKMANAITGWMQAFYQQPAWLEHGVRVSNMPVSYTHLDRLFVYQNYRNEVVELAKKFGYRNIGGAAG